MPVYNVADFVAPCLISLQRQTLRDFEVLVIVGGATDDSAAHAHSAVGDENDNEDTRREDRQRYQARYHCLTGYCAAMSREGRKHYSSEEKIRIVLDGLRGEDSIAELCRPLPHSRTCKHVLPCSGTGLCVA